MMNTTIPKQDHYSSQTMTNLGTGEVTITIHDCLQRRDKFHLSRISETNPDQIHLTLQYLTSLENETRATIYPTTRTSKLPTTVTSQT